MGQNRLQKTILFQTLDMISLKPIDLLLVPATARSAVVQDWGEILFSPQLGSKTSYYKETSEGASDSGPTETMVGHTANVSIKPIAFVMAHFRSCAKHTLLLERVFKNGDSNL